MGSPAIAGWELGETELTGQSPILRGRRGVAVGFLAALAIVSFAANEADARRYGRHGAQIESDGPPSSAIVVDANSGEVLHSSKADELRHPASLTKIMTLYLLFERLDAGKLKLDTPLSVSEHASDQAPTKLGLRPEQTIVVEDAIKGLVTRSANDAAVVIAEAIAGDERSFAEMMTHKAHALGMSRTVYRNASGLPSDEQVTTARDQATLGRAIQERFPRYYTYFSTVSFNYHGQSIRNHNQLLGRVEGVDGIKTGYTQASGYNLVTSLRRGNKHLVAVVLGGSSAGSRDAKMRNLIDEYIQVASTKKSAPAIAEAPVARETVTAQARPAEARLSESRQAEKQAEKKSAETKTADARAPAAPAPAKDARAAGRPNPAAVYAVASYSQPIPWPNANAPTPAAAAPATAAAAAPVPTPPIAAAPSVTAAPPPPVAAVAPAPAPPPAAVAIAPAPTPPPAPAPAAPATRLSAAAVAAPQTQRPAEPASEPLRPIPVKTVKVKLAPTRSASIDTPPPVKTVVDEPPPVRASERAAANVAPAPMPAPAPQRKAVVEEPAPPPPTRTTEFPVATVPVPAPTPMPTQKFTATAPVPADEEPAAEVAPRTRSAALANVPVEAPALRTSQSENAVLQTSQTDNTAAHTGWIIQVGAYDNESDAKQRLTKAQAHAAAMLSHADPFTEPVVKGDKTLYRARFAGLQKDQAEAVCKQLKRNDIDCMTVRN
jgi:D-alanyl-D-alanine carboxypeptidase